MVNGHIRRLIPVRSIAGDETGGVIVEHAFAMLLMIAVFAGLIQVGAFMLEVASMNRASTSVSSLGAELSGAISDPQADALAATFKKIARIGPDGDYRITICSLQAANPDGPGGAAASFTVTDEVSRGGGAAAPACDAGGLDADLFDDGERFVVITAQRKAMFSGKVLSGGDITTRRIVRARIP